MRKHFRFVIEYIRFYRPWRFFRVTHSRLRCISSSTLVSACVQCSQDISNGVYNYLGKFISRHFVKDKSQWKEEKGFRLIIKVKRCYEGVIRWGTNRIYVINKKWKIIFVLLRSSIFRRFFSVLFSFEPYLCLFLEKPILWWFYGDDILVNSSLSHVWSRKYA